jgi:outer membrane protein OmpA-like peptidoglycan-associated protein
VEKASKSGSKSSRKAKKPADVTQAPHSNIQETPLAPIASTASPVESSMKSDSNGMTVMPVQIPQSVTPSPQQYNEAPVAATPHLAPEQTSVPAPAQIPDPAASANLPMPQSSTPAAPGMSSSAPNSPTSIPHLDGTTAQSVAPSNSPTTLPQTPRAPVSNQVGMANQAAPHEIGGVPASESMSTRMSALQYTDNDIELKAEHMAMLDKIIADLKSDASKTVKVQSYGFSKSGDAIEARRNSLQRAIKIRKYLIEKDVSASRISVHAIEDSSNTQNKVELQIESGSASR